MKHAIGLVVACLLLVHAVPAATKAERPPVAGDFVTPTIVVPFAEKAPTIDGKVDDTEWQGACSVTALRTVRGQVSGRQTRYRLCWDRDNLYLAMRSWLRPGERPVQRFRGEDGDPMVVFDDSYEFYFDTGGTLAGDLPAYTQYIGNFAGCKYDATHLPTVGIRRMSYEAGWHPKNRLTETPRGRAWEMEVAIPHASLLVPRPFKAGDEIRALLARNYKRPWEQNSIEAASVFRNTATYSLLRLAKGVPAVHVLGVGDPKAGTLGLDLTVYGATPGTVTWKYESDAGVEKTGKLAVEKGALARGPSDLAMETLPAGKPARPRGGKQPPDFFRIRVLGADGKTVLFDWASQRAFGGAMPFGKAFDDDKGDQVALSLVLNPVKDYLRVTGDFINFDTRAQIAGCRVSVADAGGRELAAKDLKLDPLAFVRDVLWLRDLKPGHYTARLVCRNAKDDVLVERETAFEKRDPVKAFPWWNTTKGDIERVIPPWTPVKLDGNKLAVWGREMTAGAAGLPAAVRSQGREVLAAPCRLEATLGDGRTVSAGAPELKVESQAEHRVVLRTESRLADLRVHSRVTTEFDGMYKVELTLDPARPVAVKELRVVVPLRNEKAEYLTACGEGIRWGYDNRLLPRDAQGEIWNCLKVDGQRMAAGSFIPYVWVGDSYGGLCWFADTDKGWVPNDKVPAIVLRRDTPASCDLILNLIGSDFTIVAPRTIVFAFQATPVKKLVDGWRRRVYSFGDTFKEWQCAEKVGSNRMMSPVPWTFDVAKCRKMVAAQHAAPRMLSLYPSPAIPYGRHNELVPRLMPEARYFGEDWNSKGSWHLYYSKTLVDYWIWNLDRWIASCDIDGYYSDNTHPAVCFNVEAGRGYRLPDGRVQPAYNLFGLRRYFLRVRAVFAEHGKQGWIVTHETHNMVMPSLGACDIALDGEDHTVTPRQNRTWMDAWPLERIRADVPRALGVATTFKTE